MYPLFESIRLVNGVPQNLAWHQKRIDRSFLRFYGFSSNFTLREEMKVPNKFGEGIVKARLKYSDVGRSTTFEHYQKKKIHTLKCVVADDLNYKLKYSDRSQIDHYYKLRNLCNDVLLIRKGLVADTSYSNIIFYDGGEWLTPCTPLLEGTQRAKLIYEGIIKSRVIYEKDLHKYQGFQLINAMLPFEDSELIPMHRVIR